MTLSDEDWIIKHKKHCLGLTLDKDFVKKKVINVKKTLDKLYHESNKKKSDIDFNIKNIIIEKLKKRLLNSKEISLLCSGGEDSIYLLMILVKELNIKPKLICYKTKNNLSDVRRLEFISNNLNLDLYLYDKTNLDRYTSYDKFCISQGRPPNDIAQPVHNALYVIAKEIHKSDIVIDGQFCDTVLLSNPQNLFLLWIEKVPFIFKSLIKLSNYLPLDKNKIFKSRLKKLTNLLDYPNSVERIFKLINLENFDDELIKYTENLIKQYGVQLTFTIYFFFCLIELRERDKYLLCPDLFSPFDDFKFAILANANIDQVLSLFIRKKPIRNLCRKYFSKLFRFQNTLPFEIE